MAQHNPHEYDSRAYQANPRGVTELVPEHFCALDMSQEHRNVSLSLQHAQGRSVSAKATVFATYA